MLNVLSDLAMSAGCRPGELSFEVLLTPLRPQDKKDVDGANPEEARKIAGTPFL